jgi:hypothetical protein
MPRIDPKNVTHYWCDPHARGLSLLRADFTSHEYKPHTHEELVVAATERGGAVALNRRFRQSYGVTPMQFSKVVRN